MHVSTYIHEIKANKYFKIQPFFNLLTLMHSHPCMMKSQHDLSILHRLTCNQYITNSTNSIFLVHFTMFNKFHIFFFFFLIHFTMHSLIYFSIHAFVCQILSLSINFSFILFIYLFFSVEERVN